MYCKLLTQGDETPFFLESESEQGKILIRRHFQIENLDEWPEATQQREISEWRFTCSVKTSNFKTYRALQFTYLDYPGEGTTEPGLGNELDEKFKQADALLGMLDGRQILALMRGEKSADRFVSIDLRNLLRVMNASDKPIHFVIMKWDLLKGKYTLKDVRDQLLKIEVFRQFIQSRKKCPTRLIPVSSIGDNFAIPQADGSMQKVPGKVPEPYQVEMPLACILPDILVVQLRKLLDEDATLSALLAKPDRRDAFLKTLNAVLPAVQGARIFLRGLRADRDQLVSQKKKKKKQNNSSSSKFATGIIIDILLNEYLDRLVSYAMSRIKAKKEEAVEEGERLRIERNKTLEATRDQETAIKHFMKCFECLSSQLEHEFPESDLSIIEYGDLS